MTDNPTTTRKRATPAEEIRRLLDELHAEIVTREKVPHYRHVRRANDRVIAVLDWRTHIVREPGLLTQLGVAHTTTTPGVVVPGASVPSRSPGWDEDGALTPLVSGGSPDPAEPVTDAWHVADDIRHELDNLGRDLHARGYRPPATLVTIALDDPDTGEWIAARLRGVVSRARIAADYDAPPVTLRDICCRYCGGELRVRADASSAVWCEGWLPVQGPALPGDPDWPAGAVEWGPLGWVRCGARWPRGAWVGLLAEAERGQREAS